MASCNRLFLYSASNDSIAAVEFRPRAPSLITSRDHPKANWALWAEDVDAVVFPSTAFGGAGALSLAQQVPFS